MIQTLEIQNRQSWQSGRLDFSPGINLIIGRGTAGKSGILRALRWALENTAGESQISNWIKRTTKGKDPKKVLDGESSVTVTTPKGTLKRFRNTDSNGYEVLGKTLKAIGTGVPEEVKDFFNLSDVNFQRQHDLPFLISLPGSQVSAYLNRVVGIEEIDRYLTASTSCIREARKAHTALLDAQEADTKALEALGWVDGIQGQLDALDALEAAKGDMESKLSKVAVFRCSLETEHAKLSRAQALASLAPKAADLRKLAQAVTGVGSRLSSVSRLVSAWEAAVESRDKAAKVAGLSGRLQEVEATRARLEVAETKLQRVLEWVGKLRTVKESLQVASRVAGLSGHLEALRRDRVALEEQEARLDALHGLCSRWSALEARVLGSRKLAALEPMLSKVRRTARVLEDRRGDLERLKLWGLTIQGLKDKLESKRSEVSGLEAKRPERCPLCGGAYGKGECDADV